MDTEQKTPTSDSQVDTLVRRFYFGFAYRYKGDIVKIENIRDYILDRHGIDCTVEQRHDGVILGVRSIQAMHTISKDIKYSHNYVIAHHQDSTGYHIYIQSERKEPRLRIAL